MTLKECAKILVQRNRANRDQDEIVIRQESTGVIVEMFIGKNPYGQHVIGHRVLNYDNFFSGTSLFRVEKDDEIIQAPNETDDWVEHKNGGRLRFREGDTVFTLNKHANGTKLPRGTKCIVLQCWVGKYEIAAPNGDTWFLDEDQISRRRPQDEED